MVKIPTIDQITGGRLAATESVKPNFQLSNQLTAPFATIAQSAINTGNNVAKYAMEIQDSRDKTVINNLSLQAQSFLQSYEEQLYTGEEQPDGSFKQYDPTKYDELLLNFKNQVIKKNVTNNKDIKSSYVRDAITSKINLEYLQIQNRVLKEKNTRIEKEFVMSAMNSIDIITNDFIKIDYKDTNALQNNIENLTTDFYTQLESIKNYVSADTYMKVESDFWYNTAKAHLIDLTKDMSNTQLLSYVSNLENGYPTQTGSNNFDTFLLGKNQTFQTEKILSSVLNQRSDKITFQNKIDAQTEKQIDIEKNNIERTIFLGNIKNADDALEMTKAFEIAKTLDFTYDELRKMENMITGRSIYATDTVEAIHADLIQRSYFNDLNFKDVLDNAQYLTKQDAEALYQMVGSNFQAEQRRIQKSFMNIIGVSEDQLANQTTEFINTVNLNMFKVVTKMDDYLNDPNNADKFNTPEYKDKVDAFMMEGFLQIKIDLIDLTIAKIEKKNVKADFINQNNILDVKNTLKKFKNDLVNAGEFNTSEQYEPLPNVTLTGEDIGSIISVLEENLKLTKRIEQIEKVIKK